MNETEIVKNKMEEEIPKSEIYESIKRLKEIMYKTHNVKTHSEIDIAVSEVKAFIYSKTYLACEFELKCKEWKDFTKTYLAKKILVICFKFAAFTNINFNKKTVLKPTYETIATSVLGALHPFLLKTILNEDMKIDFDFQIDSWVGCMFNCFIHNFRLNDDKINYLVDLIFNSHQGVHYMDFYLLENEIIPHYDEDTLISYIIIIIYVCYNLISFLEHKLLIREAYDIPGISPYSLENKIGRAHV